MNVGFTGTQKGMTRKQFLAFVDMIESLHPNEFHHGDCVGADKQAGDHVESMTYPMIVIHPPQNMKKRAWCTGHFFRDPKPYLVRNHDIVDETDLLIATPQTGKEKLRSGTWATIRYARKRGKEILIIEP